MYFIHKPKSTVPALLHLPLSSSRCRSSTWLWLCSLAAFEQLSYGCCFPSCAHNHRTRGAPQQGRVPVLYPLHVAP
uniref:Secreted protein n=1 Tax=Knipowitschia caucasica TaxID=637954 RepID=A0AAV2J6I6_KNICA